MAGEFILTLGGVAQISGLFKGAFLKGNREPRIAMVGRSNVGKSSLINSLLSMRLAQTSAEPGKTRKIHFYKWPDADKIIADLPGYGYARASGSDRDEWAKLIHAYLKNDEGLERAVMLLDARNGPSALDEEAIKFMISEQVPMTFVFTKFDALKTQSERARRKKEASLKLLELGYDPELAIWVSAKTKLGLNYLKSVLSEKLALTAIKDVAKKGSK